MKPKEKKKETERPLVYRLQIAANKLMCLVFEHSPSRQYNVGHPENPYPGCHCTRCKIDMTDWGSEDMLGILWKLHFFVKGRDSQTSQNEGTENLPF